MKSVSSSVKAFVFRLKPKQDLKKSILEFALENKIRTGIIFTCVGSLEQVNLRFANQKSSEVRSGHFEIVSLTGTFSTSACHLHISVSDKNGNTIGGHLMDGNIIYTTAEIAVGDLTEIEFNREVDKTYNYPELVVQPRNTNAN